MLVDGSLSESDFGDTLPSDIIPLGFKEVGSSQAIVGPHAWQADIRVHLSMFISSGAWVP